MSGKNGKPLISVVVPVYNVEKYLERCVNSILAQTYMNIEIILVDDGSTDKSGQTCDLLACKDVRIKVIHKKNGGLSSARNAGMQAAEGDYITFVDSDDWISVDYADYLYKILNKYGADISVAEFQMVNDETAGFLNVNIKEELLSDYNAVKNLLYQNISNCSYAKLYKRSIFENISFPEGKLYEDLVTIYMCFAAANNIVISNKRIYAYFMREGSIVRNNFSLKKMDYYYNAYKLLERVSIEYPMLRQAAISRLVWGEIHLVVQMYECRSMYIDENRMLWSDIKKFRMGILQDRNVRKINKLVLLLSLGGQKFLYFLYVKKRDFRS